MSEEVPHRGGFQLFPCAPNLCQECATKHDPEQPHNCYSLYYQYRFYSQQGRWPVWSDAIAHCASEVQQVWEVALRQRGIWECQAGMPEVCPTEDRSIGTTTTIPSKEKKSKKHRGET